MVDRYNGIEKDPEGAFVYFQDYEELEAKHYDSAKQFYELSTEYSQLEAKLAALEKRLQAHQTRGNTTEARREDR